MGFSYSAIRLLADGHATRDLALAEPERFRLSSHICIDAQNSINADPAQINSHKPGDCHFDWYRSWITGFAK